MIVTAHWLILALGTAAGSMFFNVPFFTHSFDYFNLPLFGETSLHTAMIFDSGVYLVVVGAAITMIQTIGEMRNGNFNGLCHRHSYLWQPFI